MKTIIVDLELTQNGIPKILEIGAVLVHTKSHEILDTFSRITNSGDYPNEFITELTGITVDMAKAADPLPLVLADFWKWCGDCGVTKELASWGRGDVEDLISASKEYGVEYPEKLGCFDIKQFSRPFRQARGAKAKGGLANTLALFGLTFEGSAHSAAVDSYNTAKVLFYLEQTIEFAYDTEKRFGTMKVRNEKTASQKFFNSYVRK
jgi:inhibitor of KinA sporulation pathway (predicted exonuclease)